MFVDTYTTATNYSVYLKGTEITSIPDVIHAGVDVGNNTNISTINYTNSDSKDDVRIRTNGGILTVDAATDTVKHFGNLDKAVITAVAPHSYYENGTVKGNIEVAEGHIVVNVDAKVESVIATTANVTVDVNNNKTEVKAKDGVDLSGKVNGTTAKTVKYISTKEELQNAEGEVVLNVDIKDGVTFSSGKTIVLDANGHSINGSIDLINNGTLTIKGNGSFSNDGQLINIGNSDTRIGTQKSGGTLIIESGNFTAQECCVANLTGKDYDKSNIIINGGTFTSKDNGVLMSNGSTNVVQGANWTINGGIFNCNIKTEGYIACGIYLPNTDVAIINGGTFNVKNGAGIVCRSGKTTINKGVVINIEIDGTVANGKVGDSEVKLSVSSFIVKDTKSDYPAGEPEIINNSQYTIVEYKDKTLL